MLFTIVYCDITTLQPPPFKILCISLKKSK